MEIRVGGENASDVESLNVSANGVYFTSRDYIPVLTKLRVTLDLLNEETGESQAVACDGVVVRTEPEHQDTAISEYSVACYFTSISDQEVLESYILKHVPF
jgi:hypothetical protein